MSGSSPAIHADELPAADIEELGTSRRGGGWGCAAEEPVGPPARRSHRTRRETRDLKVGWEIFKSDGGMVGPLSRRV